MLKLSYFAYFVKYFNVAFYFIKCTLTVQGCSAFAATFIVSYYWYIFFLNSKLAVIVMNTITECF